TRKGAARGFPWTREFRYGRALSRPWLRRSRTQTSSVRRARPVRRSASLHGYPGDATRISRGGGRRQAVRSRPALTHLSPARVRASSARSREHLLPREIHEETTTLLWHDRRDYIRHRCIADHVFGRGTHRIRREPRGPSRLAARSAAHRARDSDLRTRSARRAHHLHARAAAEGLPRRSRHPLSGKRGDLILGRGEARSRRTRHTAPHLVRSRLTTALPSVGAYPDLGRLARTGAALLESDSFRRTEIGEAARHARVLAKRYGRDHSF